MQGNIRTMHVQYKRERFRVLKWMKYAVMENEAKFHFECSNYCHRRGSIMGMRLFRGTNGASSPVLGLVPNQMLWRGTK